MTFQASGAMPVETMDCHLPADGPPVLVWRAEPGRGGSFFNRQWLDFTGRTLDQELGQGWTEGIHPNDRDRCVRTFAAAFDARREFALEFRLRRHDGAWRWVLFNGRPRDEAGHFAGYVGSCVDITDLRGALDERRQALEDREALLSELHHRVKNNAQATTSFLGLQASRASDSAVAAALRSAATRIMLATLVQDRMFRVGDDTGIDLGHELAATARTALDIVGRPQIHLNVRLQDRLLLPVSQATPLVLIVNELVVNAARHAFPDGRNGEIGLLVRHASPGLGEVVLADDGIGLPEALHRNTAQGSLGLHLIPRLARQARATLRLEGSAGTRATLLFATG